MSSKNNSSLIQLINCLTQAEKRHFNLMSKRNNKDKAPLFYRLFEVLEKYGEVPDSRVKKKIPDIKISQIPNLKVNLYKQLLSSLRMFHRNHSLDILLSEQLDYARVLYNKGMHKASLDVLDKVKKLALENKQFMMAQNILEFEKHIESQHITGSMSKKADLLYDQSLFLISRNKKAATLSSASLQLYSQYLKFGYVRNMQDYEDLEKFFKSRVPDLEIASLDFYEKMYYFQSHVWFYNMSHDFLNYFKFAQKWVNLFHEYPAMIQKETSAYIKGLHNVLNALFLAGKYDRFSSALDELNTLSQQSDMKLNRNVRSQLILFINIHQINLHYMEGSFSEGLEDIPRLTALLDKNEFQWDVHRIMVFYYKIACLYFGAGHNEDAIFFLNKILNNYIPHVREDIQSFARILNLLAHFELGNEFLISYQIKSVYRFLLKMEDLHAVQREILKFLRKTPRLERKDLKQEFYSLKERLLTIQELPFEKRPFLYLDIISWLESKIEGKQVEEVIARNFRKVEARVSA